ncbi:MAG: hypothetical protein WCS77_07050 [Elusimicrobiaceae bacterium]
MNELIVLFKRVLGKFHRCYGIYVEDDVIYITRLISSFRNPRPDKVFSGPLTKDKELSHYLKEAFPYAKPPEERIKFFSLFSHKKEKKSKNFLRDLRQYLEELPEIMAVGFKDTSVFYYAFAVSQKQTKVFDVDLIVNENPKAEFLHSKKLIYDWINFSAGDQHYVLLAAARRSFVAKVWKDFDDLGLAPFRFEPGTMAALRAAWQVFPPGQGSLPEIRVLVGQKMTLVALNMGRTPLSWHLVKSDSDNLAESLFSTVQNFIIYAKRQFSPDGISKVVMQGQNPDKLVASKLSEMIGYPCEMHPFRPYDGHLISYGLALGTLSPEMKTMSLTREIQKPVSLLTTFPYMESIIASVVILLTAFYLGIQTEKLQKNVRLRIALNSQIGWAANQSNADLENSIKKMEAEIAPIKTFYMPRVPWSEILVELAAITPTNVRVLSINGKEPMWEGKKTEMQIKIVSRRGADGTRPEAEIEKYLDLLKESKNIVKWYPKMKLSEVTMSRDGEQIFATIAFTTK